MNPDTSLLHWTLVASWGACALFVFAVEMVKSYLVDYRYRELREDTTAEKSQLRHLFSMVDDTRVYRRTFGATLQSVVTAASGVAGVLLWFGGYLVWRAPLPELVGLVLLVIGLLVAAVLHGLLLKWLPVALGQRVKPPAVQLATLYVAAFAWLLRPLRAGIDLGIRLFGWWGIKESDIPEPIDRDFQILAINREDVMFTPVTEKIASRALELSSISVYDILLPRSQVQIFDLEDSLDVNLEKARRTGHTRFPLCTGDLDHCEGLIHIKDLFRMRRPVQQRDLRRLMRPVLRVGESEPLDKILQLLLTKRMHMALVEDEFGGVLGVLTLERILEELVGEIQDEFDKEDRMIVPLRKDFFKIMGMTPIYEVEDQLGVDDLEQDEVSSFGGLISYLLGRIPVQGEQLEIGRLVVTVQETDDTRIISTTVKLLPPLEDEEE
jgi:CBS domain containing-hemolysin-like protein